MPLRRLPNRTPALVAAGRANARKAIRPVTPAGKACSALNALEHGRCSTHLGRTLAPGRSHQGARIRDWLTASRLPETLKKAFSQRGFPRQTRQALAGKNIFSNLRCDRESGASGAYRTAPHGGTHRRGRRPSAPGS